MVARILIPSKSASFFLLGPRGTGKSTWTAAAFPDAPRFDLLDDATFAELAAEPRRLEARMDAQRVSVAVIDEVGQAAVNSASKVLFL